MSVKQTGAIMKFPKELLIELIGENLSIVPGEGLPPELCGQYETVINSVVDRGRWTVYYDFVFSFEKDGVKRYFREPYEVGATEEQDNPIWEDEPAVMEVSEVEPYEVTTIEYKWKKNGS